MENLEVNNIDENVENNEHTIKHIVLSGGGTTGLSFYGILRETNKMGKWSIHNIKTIYATSIGSFIATILCLDYDWETLDNYFIKRPWQTVFQCDIYSAIKVFHNKGIFGIKTFEDMLGPLLLGKELSIDITMLEFFEKTGIEIHCFSTEINKLNSIDISYKTHPDWRLVQAIYCSSCLPIVFEPWIDDNNCYLDGGMLVNYPLNQCIRDTKSDMYSILGIQKNNKHVDKYISKNSSFLDFIMIVFHNAWDRILLDFQGDHIFKPVNSYVLYENTVNLQDIIQTATSMEERIRLIQVGHDIVHSNSYSNATNNIHVSVENVNVIDTLDLSDNSIKNYNVEDINTI